MDQLHISHFWVVPVHSHYQMFLEDGESRLSSRALLGMMEISNSYRRGP